MAIEVFNRYEKKYLINSEVFENLRAGLEKYAEIDKYNAGGRPYTISNIYYDTVNHDMIRQSLAKPKYKEKLRVRGYGVPERDSIVYAEIKKKFDGLTNKRRSKIRLDDAYKFIEGGISPKSQPYSNAQVLREIEYILQGQRLVPAVYIAYDRVAYFEKGNSDLRISFDTNVRTRRTELRLESGTHGDLLLPRDQWILEIKTRHNMPVWLAELLVEYKVYPKGFSKYGTEFENQVRSGVQRVNQYSAKIYPFPSVRSEGFRGAKTAY